MKGLVSDNENLEDDNLSDGDPVKLLGDLCDLMKFLRVADQPGSRGLDRMNC